MPRRMTDDPLRLHVALPHERRFAIAGVPVRFAAEEADLLAAVDLAFGRWPVAGADPRVTLRLLAESEGREPPAEVPFRARLPDGDHLVMFSGGSLGFADAARGLGVCYISPTLREDPERLAFRLLTGLTLTLITRQDRVPVHAAVVERGGTALVLSAPSGVGKSTVAYAAREAGFHVVADDAAYIQQEPSFGLWGTPGTHDLPEDAPRWFAETGVREVMVMPNGHRKRRVPRAAAVVGPWPDVRVCLLERRGGPLVRRRVAPDVLVERLAASLGPAADLYTGTLHRALRALAPAGGWCLNLGPDPREAVPHLIAMLSEPS